ncbi:hypothetical protein SAMN04488570_2018 [Nocardioides scoriae]|uniref:Peptidase propeptide and YPEB domain-containing protein n=1 Tax=Nocardioides scoriae TaxID=642780 RepID=A0A1H1SQU5_9ACTN|nr:hypothetical protein [Nocardioides scoriae]SDS50106.1 hypothetical protein SAMN04488570_2018 [Nocardioides scoriae]
MTASKKAKALAVGGTLVVAGFGAGAVLAATGSASATSGGAGYGYGAPGDARGDHDGDGHRGGPGGGGQGETPLTGTTADKVEAAALAAYPGATVDRLETDSEGVYEAHVTTADGEQLVVQVGRDFTVTGTQSFDGGGGRGDHDGDGPGGDRPAPSEESSPSA